MKDLICLTVAYFLFACLLFVFICLSTFKLSAAPFDLTFHTDNPQDFESYKLNQPSSMGTATAMLVLSRLKHNVKFAYMTTTRSMVYLDKKRDICVINRIKTPEREQKFIFTAPVNIYLTKHLFQSERFAPLPTDLLDKNGAVYLPDLFARFPQRTIVYSSQITQGSDLDAQLEMIPAQNKVIRNGSAHEDGVMLMFRRQRADYLLLFPQALIEGHSVRKGVRSYAIAKTEQFLIGHFMCADTPRMRVVVEELNQILEQLQQQGLLFETHLKWLRDEDRANFERVYELAFN